MAMIKSRRMVALGCALIALGAPGLGFAGKFSGEKIKPEMKYKVTQCERPDAPKIKGNSLDDYNLSVSAYEAYMSKQHEFSNCVERAVGGDMKILQEVIFTGGQEAIAQSQRDIDRIKQELDFLRSRLEKSLK